MQKKKQISPAKVANKLNRILETYHRVHGGDRFPINVNELAFGSAEFFGWDDPITKIKKTNIKNFEGLLTSNERKTKWMIAYNSELSSAGRILFTKAHELGHYILHREKQTEFMCTREDMLEWEKGESIESQADKFASYLLMPLDDFRAQVSGQVNLESLGLCLGIF